MSEQNLNDRTGEVCLRRFGGGIDSICEAELRRDEEGGWRCQVGHRWTDVMTSKDEPGLPVFAPSIVPQGPRYGTPPAGAVRRLAPLDTWPMVRVSVNVLPWSWRILPWRYIEWPATISFEWLFLKIEWMAQDRRCDWFHEIYNPETGEYWVEP